ncbi:response regulator transcription factor [Ahrensia sp. 13_GOM-1096m]|uniref:response regulator transcription factor n=1 Tax=Ahrensia sp. 13_GOM-1096m TaxID=1380380 RepID=UPI0006851C2D|nr:response regulator transcription factor [Ahrensia sp. 13_GOM-1096m]
MQINERFSGAPTEMVSIAFIGATAETSRCYAHAIETEIQSLQLQMFDDVDTFLNTNIDSGVSLIIVKSSQRSQLLKNKKIIEERFPHQIICLAYDDRSLLTGCLEAAAEYPRLRSFLPMNIRLDIWLAAIKLMLSGGSYMPSDIMRLLKSNRNSALQVAPAYTEKGLQVFSDNGIVRLTSREREVLKLVSEGQQNKNVAIELGLSEHTIKLHMHHIFSKLGVSNRTQAAAMFKNEAIK